MGELALVLFWPALVGYGEAAVAYAGEVVRPGTLGRYAIWGVRLGWLAQTALLIAQAAHAAGFPWSSWGGSLNLFVWMSVGVYLIWGCRPPYRLLGLAVMPPAAVLLALAWASGGVESDHRSDFGSVFLAFHVGLVIAAFAAFALAAAMAALYVWQDRRLKRHARGVLRTRLPGLSALDRLIARTIAVALPALTLGIGVGLARLGSEDASLDPIIVVTLVTWVVYAAFLFARYELGWRGRRSAYLALAGFLLVVVIRIGLVPVDHF
ncbi:MAG: cytochrome c biogenesis protein CcsA [Thermoleophilia bacterium]